MMSIKGQFHFMVVDFRFNQLYQTNLNNDLNKIKRGEQPESQAFDNMLLLITKDIPEECVPETHTFIHNDKCFIYFDESATKTEEMYGNNHSSYCILLQDTPDMVVGDFMQQTDASDILNQSKNFQKNVIIYLNSRIENHEQKIDVNSNLTLGTLRKVIENMNIPKLKDFDQIDEEENNTTSTVTYVTKATGENNTTSTVTYVTKATGENNTTSTEIGATTSTSIETDLKEDRKIPWKACLISFGKIIGYPLLVFICLIILLPIILFYLPIILVVCATVIFGLPLILVVCTVIYYWTSKKSN